MNSVGTMISALARQRKREPKVYIGKVAGRFFEKEWLTESELNHHVHIVGASGFGKTVLLSHIIRQRIAQGRGLLFIDLKGDIETIQKYQMFAANAGRSEEVSIFSLGHVEISARYNFLRSGTATQLRDRLMIGFNWSEEFYKNQSASFLLKLLMGLCWCRDNKNEALDITTLHKMLSNPDSIEQLCLDIPLSAGHCRIVVEELATSVRSTEYWNSLQGLRTQVESLVLSDFGMLLTSAEDSIDIFEAAQGSKLIFIFLDSRRYGETAKVIGKFLLQDLKAASSRIDASVPKTERVPFSVIIDEFADLAQEDFIGFLDRARSSKISIVVAHQELCDLEQISSEFAGRLMGNTSTIYAFLQKRSESAELLSGIAGTRAVFKKTERHTRQLFFNFPTGETSVRETEEFIIHPNAIKSLEVGECVAIKKYPHSRSHKVRVAPEA